MHAILSLPLALASLVLAAAPLPAADGRWPAWASHEASVAEVRKKLLSKLAGAANAARRAGDAHTVARLEAQREGLDRDGQWPEGLDAPELLAGLWKAQASFVATMAVQVRALRQRRPDAAKELERFAEVFAASCYWGAWRAPLEDRGFDSTSGWRRAGGALRSPAASSSPGAVAPLVVPETPGAAFVLALEVERLAGEGPLWLELPDCGGGRIELTVGSPPEGAGGSRRTGGAFTSGRAQLLVQWSDRDLFVLCGGRPLLRADGIEWAFVEERGRARDLVLGPLDAASSFAVHGLELKALSAWPIELIDAAGDPETVATELTEGSEWRGVLALDGKDDGCTVLVESRESDLATLRSTSSRLRLSLRVEIDGSKLEVVSVEVLRDQEHVIPRTFHDARIRGSVRGRELRLKGSWRQEHPRAGTGKRSVALQLERVR